MITRAGRIPFPSIVFADWRGISKAQTDATCVAPQAANESGAEVHADGIWVSAPGKHEFSVHCRDTEMTWTILAVFVDHIDVELAQDIVQLSLGHTLDIRYSPVDVYGNRVGVPCDWYNSNKGAIELALRPTMITLSAENIGDVDLFVVCGDQFRQLSVIVSNP